MSLFRLEKSDRTAAIDKLFKYSSPTNDYILMLIISIVIVTIGLLIDNAPIVIGGMLVAPMLHSVLSLGMGVVMADSKLINRSVIILIKSIAIAVLIAFLISILVADKQVNQEILSIVSPSLAFFLVALASGVAASFALSRPGLSEVLPGIAVAVALIPPLGAMGIGLSSWQWDIVRGSFLLFLLNLMGIIFASIAVFSMMGFYEERKEAERKITEEEREKEME